MAETTEHASIEKVSIVISKGSLEGVLVRAIGCGCTAT